MMKVNCISLRDFLFEWNIIDPTKKVTSIEVSIDASCMQNNKNINIQHLIFMSEFSRDINAHK